LISPRDQPAVGMVVGKPCVAIHDPLLQRVHLSASSNCW
jgi:hypothetical protein